jgi:hypothetical protein
VRSNDIISFLMVEGLRYNAVITCLMKDQNTNEPAVMWTIVSFEVHIVEIISASLMRLLAINLLAPLSILVILN